MVDGIVYAVLGAGLAMGMAGISTAIGVASAGVSGAGAVAENKENFKNAMILQAMPQTQTIYAFITALFIVMGTGLLAGSGAQVPEWKGLAMLGAGLLVGLTAISAVAQGKISGAGIAACAKNPDAFAPSIIFSGQAETPAIFGFVMALIILVVGLSVLG
ncbi:MAG: V-type ATP synthase subunit K [Candidatus Diapherotrites archaeon]|nr:V-type ATP synthase subunit K [Candidatus Diapherotrites archaeon]